MSGENSNSKFEIENFACKSRHSTTNIDCMYALYSECVRKVLRGIFRAVDERRDIPDMVEMRRIERDEN